MRNLRSTRGIALSGAAVVALAAGEALLWVPGSAIAGDASSVGAEGEPVAATRKACVDPATGQLVSPAERPECASELEEDRPGEAEAVEDTAEGELEAVPLERGGEKVDLKGRFRQERSKAPQAGNFANGGRIAIIDPQTGQVVSGAGAALLEEIPTTQRSLRQFKTEMREMLTVGPDAPPLQAIETERGGVKVDLQGRFRTPIVARIGKDGSIAVAHPETTADVQDFLKQYGH